MLSLNKSCQNTDKSTTNKGLEMKTMNSELLRKIKEKATSKAFWSLFFKFYEESEDSKG